jgi:tripartite-type tricarboxylate transporter receptor subunit TctC
MMIAANPGAGLNSLQDLLKAKDRSLSIGTAGNGSVGHLATELFMETSGVKLTHVPYRGGGPALTDVLGGQIQLIFDNASQLYPYAKAGKLRALAVTGAHPYAPGPEVPTVKSVLGKDFEAYSWFGLVAPKGTPEPVIEKLREVMAKAAASPEVRKELEAQGLEPGVPAREFESVIANDYRKWSGIISRAHVQAE